MRPLLLDLSSTFRNLRRSPLFLCVAVGVLALGIASNAVVFTVVDSVLLRPLPYRNASRIVIVQGQERQRNMVGDLEAPAFFFLRAHADSLEDVAAAYPTEAGVNLAGAGRVNYVKALRVSREFFLALGTSPLRGRTFSDSEDSSQGPRVAVVSYPLWTRMLGRLPIDGRSRVRINGDEYTVIGVMPEGFHSYPDVDLWLPLQLDAETANLGTDYRVLARIRAGVSMGQAQAELKHLSDTYPVTQIPALRRVSLVLTELHDFQSRDVRNRLTFLSTAVFLLLLIACSNIAMLLLVRTSARTHEIAIRSALGSSRARLVQAFLLEGAVLALLGGLFGIILAKEILPFVVSLAPIGAVRMPEIHIDGRVMVFTLAVAGLIAALFGTAPALKLSRNHLQAMLGETTLRTTARLGQMHTGRLLLVLQAALTLILLSGSTLLLRHLLRVQHIDPGFKVHNTFVAQLSLSAPAWSTTRPTARILDEILRRLKNSTHIEEAAYTNGLPLETGLNMPAHPVEAPNQVEGIEYRLVSHTYFDVLGIPIVQGRRFRESDRQDTEPVAIVNETLARKWWPQMNATGRTLTVGEELGPEFTDKPRLIVGVAADVRESNLDYPARPTLFLPLTQAPDRVTAYANKYVLASIMVRVSEPLDPEEQVRDAVVSSAPDLAVASFRPMRQVVTDSFARDRFYTFLTVTFGTFALLTVTVGFYGFLSYQLSLRAREIAVRTALGGRRVHLLILALRQGMQLLGWGAMLGGVGAYLLMRMIADGVYNGPTMAWSAFMFAIMLLGIVYVLASALSTLHVGSMEPVAILRNG